MQKIEVTYYKGVKLINDMMRTFDMDAVYMKETATLTFKKRITPKHITQKWKEGVIKAFSQAGDACGIEFTNFTFRFVEESEL